MNGEPRFSEDYSERQVRAARRVLVDIGQVLASFKDCIVIVGGWVPDLIIEQPHEPHVGSIDVDIALDAIKLMDGRYAELLSLLLETQHYQKGDLPFQLYTVVDLDDGEAPIRVDVDFLAQTEIDLRSKRKTRIVDDFRVQQADGCIEAFHSPQVIALDGQMVSGAANRVELRVASLPDFLVMKCYALRGRDKPKDAYDICYCLDNVPGGVGVIADDWRGRLGDDNIRTAIGILREKFETVGTYGPQQVAIFKQPHDKAEHDIEARRAFELVQRFLELL